MELIKIFPIKALTQLELFGLLPLFILSFGAVFALIAGAHKSKGHSYAFMTSVVTLVLALGFGLCNIGQSDITLLGGTLNFSPFTKTVAVMLNAFALIAVIIHRGQDQKENLLSEIYALTLFASAGMILMVSTTHLIFMFLALEIMSLAIYVMVSMRRTSSYSAEAGMKYFILGGLASAIFLYGSSLVFGSAGSFDVNTVSLLLTAKPNVSILYFIGSGMIISALLFKVGAFPFQGWVPDVYQGAPTNVTAFMGAAVKFTAFLAFARVAQGLIFVEAIPELKWFNHVIWLAAAASMIYGNFVAISQKELKRMLSFSTIAHTGYLLLGIYAMSIGGLTVESLVIYLFFYALANLGAFAIIAQFEEKNQKDLTLDQISGLGMKHPVLGAFLTIFLLSMAGIPITSGFIGKFGLFSSAVNAGEVPLVVIAVLTSVVSVFYYLRVIVYLFMKEETAETAKFQALKGASVAAFLTALATIQFGLFPKAIVSFIKLITK